MSGGTPYVAVVGPGEAGAHAEKIDLAEAIGRGLAEAGAIVVCGGLGGVMEAVCKGASHAGGLTVGILPGFERKEANQHVRVAIPTGLGELRNGLVVRAADVVVALGGGHGTLSEIALALKSGTPVVAIGSWEIDGVERVDRPEEAVTRALRLAGTWPRSSPST